jgi:hypothetical protein
VHLANTRPWVQTPIPPKTKKPKDTLSAYIIGTLVQNFCSCSCLGRFRTCVPEERGLSLVLDAPVQETWKQHKMDNLGLLEP